jgi:hypothetical protein
MGMLDILTLKITSWNQKSADVFHQHAERDSYFGAYTWETTTDGVFLVRDVCSIFFKNDGKIFKLTSQYQPNDWDLHCRLYERVIKYSDCNIEIPISSKFIDINGITFLYTEVQRPTTSYDSEIWQDAMLSNITDGYMLEWINHVSIILSHMKNVSDLLPRVLPKRLYNGTEHSWIDFKKWEIPVNQSINKNIGNLYRLMLRFESSYGILLNKQKIIMEAEKLWS